MAEPPGGEGERRPLLFITPDGLGWVRPGLPRPSVWGASPSSGTRRNARSRRSLSWTASDLLPTARAGPTQAMFPVLPSCPGSLVPFLEFFYGQQAIDPLTAAEQLCGQRVGRRNKSWTRVRSERVRPNVSPLWLHSGLSFLI